jgi:hypothetical protein
VDLEGGGEILGYLVTGVAAADRQDWAVGDLRRVAVGGRARLAHARVETLCRPMARAGPGRARGHDDRAGVQRPVGEQIAARIPQRACKDSVRLIRLY